MKKISVYCILVCISLLCSGCADSSKKEMEKGSGKPLTIQTGETERKDDAEQGKDDSEQSMEDNKIKQEKEQHTKDIPEKEPLTNGKTIVIDPGHSAVVAEGTEPVGPGSEEYKAADTSGTRGTSTGIPEYELTLSVSKKLKIELENRGYTVLMTRETNDIPLSCTQRAAVANQSNAEAFIRIHANGSENSEAEGAMTICTTPESPYAGNLYQQSRALSDCIINNLCEVTGCENDGVWETDSMSGNNWSQVPVTIVEMGYMTNPQEDEMMANEEYQNKIVQGIADGIDEFISLLE